MARRAGSVYGLAVALAVLGSLAAAGAVVDLGRGFDVGTAQASHLRVLGQPLTAPAVNLAAAAVLPLAALGATCVVRGRRSGARQIVAQRRFLDTMVITGRLASHPEVLLIDDVRPQAF